MIIDSTATTRPRPRRSRTGATGRSPRSSDPARAPSPSDLQIGDDELRESIEANQLATDARARHRPDDLHPARQLHGASHRRLRDLQPTWAAICNELCYRVRQLFPDHFVGAAMLPQSPGVDPATCIPELERCVERVRLRRHQPQPRSVGRPLDQPAADRPLLVSDLREDGRARHPGDGPRDARAATPASTPPARTTSTPTRPRSCS